MQVYFRSGTVLKAQKENKIGENGQKVMEKLELRRLRDQTRREATDLDHHNWQEGDKTHTRPWRVRLCL